MPLPQPPKEGEWYCTCNWTEEYHPLKDKSQCIIKDSNDKKDDDNALLP